jgi:hypothetical protein
MKYWADFTIITTKNIFSDMNCLKATGKIKVDPAI